MWLFTTSHQCPVTEEAQLEPINQTKIQSKNQGQRESLNKTRQNSIFNLHSKFIRNFRCSSNSRLPLSNKASHWKIRLITLKHQRRKVHKHKIKCPSVKVWSLRWFSKATQNPMYFRMYQSISSLNQMRLMWSLQMTSWRTSKNVR
jgi:hypothetical protein